MPQHEHIQGISTDLLSTSCGESGACKNLIPYDIYIEMFSYYVGYMSWYYFPFPYTTRNSFSAKCLVIGPGRIENITEVDKSWSPINWLKEISETDTIIRSGYVIDNYDPKLIPIYELQPSQSLGLCTAWIVFWFVEFRNTNQILTGTRYSTCICHTFKHSALFFI